METGQSNRESTALMQKILREEDSSGASVSLGVSREVCTMDLISPLSFFDSRAGKREL